MREQMNTNAPTPLIKTRNLYYYLPSNDFDEGFTRTDKVIVEREGGVMICDVPNNVGLPKTISPIEMACLQYKVVRVK